MHVIKQERCNYMAKGESLPTHIFTSQRGMSELINLCLQMKILAKSLGQVTCSFALFDAD